MENMNVGIIGCGRISDLHYAGYIGRADARVYAVCDVDESKALEKKNQWNAVKHYTDYRELLADKEVDAVEILSPQPMHEKMVVEAVVAKKHIALQKPMTTDLQSARRILDAAKTSDKVFRVSDNYIFYPPIVLAKKLIEAGEIGEPTNIRIKMISGGAGGWDVPEASWEWRKKESQAGRGRQTFDHGHHLWALSLFLLGDVEKVVSWIDSIDGDIDSPAVIMWKHTRGIRYGSCEYVHAPLITMPSRYYANDEWIEVSGTKGVIMIDRCTGELKQGPPVSMFNHHGWRYFPDVPSDWAEGFKASCANFIGAVQGKEKPALTGEEALKVLAFDLAVAKSAREKKEVFL